MQGYIKLYRQVLDNPIVCKDNDFFRVWIFLLLSATHTGYSALFNGERIELLPGQLITGRKSISEKCGVSESKVQRILKVFENEQQIEQRTCSKNRLVTVLNWNKFQNSEQPFDQQLNNEWTAAEQQLNTNKNIKNVKKADKGKNSHLAGDFFLAVAKGEK